MKTSLFGLLCILGPLLAACATQTVTVPATTLAPSATVAVTPTAVASEVTAGPTGFICPVTATVLDEPPKDPNADAFGRSTWFINADRTLWAGSDPQTWQAGPDGNKTIWIRPAGTDLKISGRSLDGDPDPVRADIPCCYLTGFQVAGLYFPRAGCWQVTATAGSAKLRFTLLVK